VNGHHERPEHVHSDRDEALLALAPFNPGVARSDSSRWQGTCNPLHCVTVSGNLRITFEFDGENATRVDLEDYH
jgi:hypothetical protein